MKLLFLLFFISTLSYASFPFSFWNKKNPPIPIITGGTLTTSGAYSIRTFTGNGTLSISAASINIEYLIIGGGGFGEAAPGSDGAGGGAGGFLTNIGSPVSTGVGSYSIVIGAGGTLRNNGGNSSFNSIISYGGGFGGAPGCDGSPGNSGGSGGGGGGGSTGCLGAAGGSGVTGQGTAGSAGLDDGGIGGLGGGAGGLATGLASSISGSSITYAKGGAPSCVNSANSGDGGCFNSSAQSGIVIIRYLTP
jgi:hypothetical protein